MKIYLVGGAVRDELLGRPVADRDWVVVGANAQTMESLGYRRIGKSFPVFLHPKSNEEYALARTERKVGRGYTGFDFEASESVTLEEDLLRRDLTINAIAKDENGELIDPFKGQEDLARGVLRHISDAFTEDPLRVLRTCRFAARYAFKIADTTRELLKEIVASGELAELPAERVWNECQTAINEEHPQIFIETMRDCGALKAILPEVDCLFGTPQPPKHHPEIDTGEHICLAMKQAAAFKYSSIVRYAVLLHDVGKGITPAELLPKHIGHESAGVPLVENISARLKVPRSFRELAVVVAKHHLEVHRVREMKPKALLRLLNALDALRRPERLEHILQACQADATGRKGLQEIPYRCADYVRGASLAVRQVSASEMQAQGNTGEDFLAALNGARLAALKNFIDSYEQR